MPYSLHHLNLVPCRLALCTASSGNVSAIRSAHVVIHLMCCLWWDSPLRDVLYRTATAACAVAVEETTQPYNWAEWTARSRWRWLMVACWKQQGSTNPSCPTEIESSKAIHRAGETRTRLEPCYPWGMCFWATSQPIINPLLARSLKLVHRVMWQTPVRKARIQWAQRHGRP